MTDTVTYELRRARWLGIAVAAVGLVDVLSVLIPHLASRLDFAREVFTIDAVHLAFGATALIGLALMLLGRGIANRRRLAFWIALVLLLAGAVTHVVKGFDIEEAILDICLAITLWMNRRIFVVGFEPARRSTLYKAIPVVLGLYLLYGVGGLTIRHHDVPNFSFGAIISEVVARFIGLSTSLKVGGNFGHWFPASLTVVGISSIALLVIVLFAPMAEDLTDPQPRRDEVRHMIDRLDGDTLDPFALRRDKRYVTSSDGLAAIAYRVVNGVGLASGDPIGEPSSHADAVQRFVQRCNRRGWRPAVLGVRADHLEMFEEAGLHGFYIGDEAVIDVRTFSLEGRAMRPVRQAVSRTDNFGVTVEIHHEGELEPTLRRALIGISDKWRKGNKERGFSMALDELLSKKYPECVVVVCRDHEGTPIAFQRYVPCKASRGLSLDAMRREVDSPNGVNERMIVELIEWAREHAVRKISLNFAVMRSVLEESEKRNAFESIEAWVVRRFNPYFQIESLLNFNAKFHPEWVRRYLVYRATGDFGPVAMAALSAEAFLPFDREREAASNN